VTFVRAQCQHHGRDPPGYTSLESDVSDRYVWIKTWNATARSVKWTKAAGPTLDCSYISGPGCWAKVL